MNMNMNMNMNIDIFKKLQDEDNNSIIFDCTGAIDYIEQLNIELSLTPKEGFIEIKPLLLERKISFKHIQNIITNYFIKIVKRIPRISDENESLPLDKRFTVIYYKCYNKFHHSHDYFGKYKYTNVSLDDAINYIDKNNFGIRLP